MSAQSPKHISLLQRMFSAAGYPWYVWAIATIYLLHQFFLQLSASLVAGQWQYDFSLNATRLGLLSSSYYYIYVSLQVPAGFLVDRFGARLLLTYGALICALGSWGLSGAHDFVGAEIGRVLMGGGLSFAFVGAVYLIGRWFSKQRFPLMLSLTEMLAMSGTLISMTGVASIVVKQGWRHLYGVMAVVSASLAVLVIAFVRNRPPLDLKTDTSDENSLTVSELLRQTRRVIMDAHIWRLGLYTGFMFAIVTVFGGLWDEPFFIAAYHLQVAQIAKLNSCLIFGIVLGCPMIGWLGMRIQRLHGFLVAMALLSALLIVIILQVTSMSYWLVAALMVLIGFCCSGYILAFTMANGLAPGGCQSTCIGFINMLAMATAPLMQPLIGWVLDAFFAGDLKNHLHHYTVQAYQTALLVVPLGLLIAAALVMVGPRSANSAR